MSDALTDEDRAAIRAAMQPQGTEYVTASYERVYLAGKRAAESVRAQTIEECARVCDEHAGPHAYFGRAWGARDCAEAIRRLLKRK